MVKTPIFLGGHCVLLRYDKNMMSKESLVLEYSFFSSFSLFISLTQNVINSKTLNCKAFSQVLLISVSLVLIHLTRHQRWCTFDVN